MEFSISKIHKVPGWKIKVGFSGNRFIELNALIQNISSSPSDWNGKGMKIDLKDGGF